MICSDVSQPTTLGWDPASFRDPMSRVFVLDGSVYRAFTAAGAHHWTAFDRTGLRKELEQALLLIPSWIPSQSPLPALSANLSPLVLEHPSIPFISYPQEWCFSMLQEAALLHLTLLENLIPKGFMLKDASPFNVQFVGPRPIFIDVGSIQLHEPGSPWPALHQFCWTMLNPLLISTFLGVPFTRLLTAEPNGIDTDTTARLFGRRYWWHPTVMMYVYLQASLERRYKTRPVPKQATRLRLSSPALTAIFSSLKRRVAALRPVPRPSSWLDYSDSHSYTRESLAAKRDFVVTAFQALGRRRLLWDLGCNTGDFSRLSGNFFEHVVAIDSDVDCVDALFRGLRRDGVSTILPLVLDIANPTGSFGWNNEERRAFFARGRPDCILALALLHHLRVSAGIPLEKLAHFIADRTDHAIVEFVSPEDPLFARLIASRRSQFDDYTEYGFREAFGRRFRPVSERRLTATRTIFFFSR